MFNHEIWRRCLCGLWIDLRVDTVCECGKELLNIKTESDD